MSFLQTLSLILIAILCNTSASLLLKKGASSLVFAKLELGPILSTFIQAALNPFIILGITFFASSFLLWVVVASKVEISYAAPFMSLTYVLIAILSKIFFGENVTSARILGIFIIILGVYFVSRS